MIMRLISNINKVPSISSLAAMLSLWLMPCHLSRAGVSETESSVFRNPSEVRSKNGVLKANLNVQETTVNIGTHQIDTITYSGEYIPPTLRVHPGGPHRADAAQLIEPSDERPLPRLLGLAAGQGGQHRGAGLTGRANDLPAHGAEESCAVAFTGITRMPMVIPNRR